MHGYIKLEQKAEVSITPKGILPTAPADIISRTAWTYPQYAKALLYMRLCHTGTFQSNNYFMVSSYPLKTDYTQNIHIRVCGKMSTATDMWLPITGGPHSRTHKMLMWCLLLTVFTYLNHATYVCCVYLKHFITLNVVQWWLLTWNIVDKLP